MKRIFSIYFLFFLTGVSLLQAQNADRLRERDNELETNALYEDHAYELHADSATSIDASTIPIDLYMWKLTRRLGDIIPVPVDTLPLNFQNEIFTSGMNGEYNFLGNLGSPRESRIFFHRKTPSQFIFTDPYSAFLVTPDEFFFTNTKSPFTNLTYQRGGSTRYGEERFKAYFAVNVNKKLGFGFKADYWYGRGQYLNQSTSLFNGAFYGSYIDNRYNLNTIISQNQIKLRENGGILDDRYITSPYDIPGNTSRPAANNIEVRLSNTWNRNRNFYVYLTHRYNLGFYRDRTDTEQEGLKEFVPVTSFIHTMDVERNSRRFIVHRISTDELQFVNYYLDNDSTNDITKNVSVKNTFSISLLEGFSKWAKAGLTAFITHEFRNFTLPDTIGTTREFIYEKRYTENIVSIGGEFAKRQGKLLHYNINGDIAVVGEDIGQFNLYGNMDLNFKLFSDTVRLDAHAFIKRTHPSFYFRHFQSNHYWWNNNLSKEFRTRIEGRLTIDRWRSQLSAGAENVKNYTYFAQNNVYTSENEKNYFLSDISVKQASENIQVFSATLKQDFKLGIFHLDNEITYQTTSNSSVLPLPELNLYHNFYINAKLAKKVLTLQLGADIRYFTKYYAPDYAPGIGQFVQQDSQSLVELGGYPFINVYANLHLKRTRFYVMMAHINQGSGNSNYFLVPHYPVNPQMFMMGLSWNFFD